MSTSRQHSDSHRRQIIDMSSCTNPMRDSRPALVNLDVPPWRPAQHGRVGLMELRMP